MRREIVGGWGRATRSATTVATAGIDDPDDLRALRAVIAAAPRRGVIARGCGRSYGDSSQNGGGVTVVLEHDPATAIRLDPVACSATVGGGASLDQLLRVSIPAGMFVPVSPGTRMVSVGGAIASDIHGKNHHVDGAFGSHVRSLRLLRADGEVVDLAPDRRPELFWATVGGMGLTGVIVDATIAMLPIETSRCSVDTERIADLDTLLEHMEADDEAFRYSVAWVDLTASGAALGRSVLTRGHHALVDELEPCDAVEPLAYAPSHLAGVPVGAPAVLPRRGLVTRTSIAAFNELWFRKAPRRRVGEIVSIPRFFHPLDAVGHWNRLYGRRGFVQYQFVVPFGAEDALRRVVERLSSSGVPSFLAVLKRFGIASPAPLSFPRPGWTLALDIPGASGGLRELLAELDAIVLDAGGRHYLAKDATTTAAAIRRGYPRLDEWRRIRDAVDPDGRWSSDQARRLGLVGDSPGERA